MAENLYLILLNNSNDIIEEANIIKSESYELLLLKLKELFKIDTHQYSLFCHQDNDKKLINNGNKEYKSLKNILFIKKDILLNQSIFSYNYDKLSESKQLDLDDKYNCNICEITIKGENPYLCYNCQKIFHVKCLEEWDKKRKVQNLILSCPGCRNELPIEKWKKKLDFQESKKNVAENLNKINEYKLDINLNKKINQFKDNEIEKLKTINKDLTNYYKNLLKSITKKISEINQLFDDNILKDILIDDLTAQDIYDLTFKGLTIIDNFIKLKTEKKTNKLIHHQDESIHFGHNSFNLLDLGEDWENEIKLILYIEKNDINKDIYFLDNTDMVIERKNKESHFHDFLKGLNSSNTIVIINDIKYKYNKYFRPDKEGEYKIKIKFKNSLKDCSYMFYNCTNLLYIDLSSFNTKYVRSMESMFSNCRNLKGINFSNCNTENLTNMGCMFLGCKKLKNVDFSFFNIKNVTQMYSMFVNCGMENIDISSFHSDKSINTYHIITYAKTLIINESFFKKIKNDIKSNIKNGLKVIFKK